MEKDPRAVYIFVYVSDLAVSRRFYGDLLGLRIIEEDEGCTKYDAGGVILALNRAADFGVKFGNRPDDTSITIFHTYGVDALRAELEQRGVEFSGPTQDLDIGKAAAFYDPDGHCYSLYQPSDMAMKWPSAQKIRAIVHGPGGVITGEEKVRNAEQERTPGTGLRQSKILYLFLFIGDVEKSKKFYADTLRLPIVEEAPFAGVIKYDAGGFILATHLVDSEEGVRAKREDLLRPKSIAPVFYVEDVRAHYAHLSAKNSPSLKGPSESGIGVTVAFQDPDGHNFYLYNPSEGARRTPSGRKIGELLETGVQATA